MESTANENIVGSNQGGPIGCKPKSREGFCVTTKVIVKEEDEEMKESSWSP